MAAVPQPIFGPIPPQLTAGAPSGPRADPNLDLRFQLVRDRLEPHEDPFGLGLPRPRDGWEDVALSLRFESWLRRPTYPLENPFIAVSWAEDFVNYLDDCSVTIYGCCEADLRTYLYHHLPLHRPLKSPQRVAATLVALRKFCTYLARHEGVSYPWANAILADEDSLRERWTSCPAGADPDDPPMIRWRQVLHEDLDRRLCLPDPGMAGGELWIEADPIPEQPEGIEDVWAASIQFCLHDELSRRWLVWREQLIAAGITDPKRARAVLVRRQREWERRPHPGLGGETPVHEVRQRKKPGQA